MLPKPPWIRVRAPGLGRFRCDARHLALAPPRHRVRGGGLSQYRRVLGQAPRDRHDHGRHLHASLRLLQCAHGPAGAARSIGARARRPRGGRARPCPCGGDLGRPRRSRRRRRRAFRRHHSRHQGRGACNDHRGADPRLPAQGGRARKRDGSGSGRAQPQSRDRALALSHHPPGRSLRSLSSTAGARQDHSARASSPNRASWWASARARRRCMR